MSEPFRDRHLSLAKPLADPCVRALHHCRRPCRNPLWDEGIGNTVNTGPPFDDDKDDDKDERLDKDDDEDYDKGEGRRALPNLLPKTC